MCEKNCMDEKLANEMGIDYTEIYNQWLLAE